MKRISFLLNFIHNSFKALTFIINIGIIIILNINILIVNIFTNLEEVGFWVK